MSTRMLLLKLTSLLALAIAGGCDSSNLFPNNRPASAKSEHTLTIKVENGTLKIGEGTLNVKSERVSEPPTLCPCCGATLRCQGLCGKPGCNCSRGQNSAASTVGNVADLPQFVTQTQKQYQCRNGVCGWYDVEVQVPLATAAKRSVAPETGGGKITVYTNGSPACFAMQAALREVNGIEFRTIPRNGISGVWQVPTAIKPDGSKWTPPNSVWEANSLAQFLSWRNTP